MPTAECLVRTRRRVGESPVWDAARNRLFFADILEPAIYALDLSGGGRKRWGFDRPVGSFGLARSGRLVVALGGSIVLFDPRTGQIRLVAEVCEDEPGVARLNDGKIGPDGAFWVGGMARPDAGPAASLFRVTADGAVARKIDGLFTSNGLAWSPDGRFMFHSDSRGRWIDRWRFDPRTGDISDRTRLRTLREDEGRPDGGAVDAEGCYWSCGVSAGCINRFSPEGKLLERIATPVPRPTMPCFGDRDMKTLFFTSLREGLSMEDLLQYPLSGSVFALRVGVAGTPVGKFADRPQRA